jgi:AcrR family transcriptional regulator
MSPLARTLNPAVHAVRREAFLDAALGLIQTKGYEEMSIQDVLDELDASRGAFYHYFDSKAALLGGVLERMTETVLETLAPVVEDRTTTAIEKFEGIFTGIARWKGDRPDLVGELLRVWLSDENAIVREKYRHSITAKLAPLLSEIIAQGIAEGFTARSPRETARVVVSLILAANQTAVDLYVARQADAVTFDEVLRNFAAYTDALERILGTPTGSLRLADEETLRRWYG